MDYRCRVTQKGKLKGSVGLIFTHNNIIIATLIINDHNTSKSDFTVTGCSLSPIKVAIDKLMRSRHYGKLNYENFKFLSKQASEADLAYTYVHGCGIGGAEQDMLLVCHHSKLNPLMAHACHHHTLSDKYCENVENIIIYSCHKTNSENILNSNY